MIELKRNVVMFTILTVGAVYFLYEDLRKMFSPMVQASKKVNHASDEITEGYIGRKLLAIDSNVNEDTLEFKTELNPFIKEKLNSNDKRKETSKSSVFYNKLGRNRMKKLSRRKREARHHDLGWKLSLNITNNENSPKEVSNLGSEDELRPKSGKEKFLNMAVQMEGASSDNSFKELHQAWDSLGILLKRLYGKNTHDITPEISTESNDIVSTFSLTEKPEKERTPKFLFGLLNFRNGEKPPLEGIGTTLENRVSSESVTSQTSIAPMEGPKPKFFSGLLNFGNSENPPLESIGTTLGNRVSSESVTSQTSVAPMEEPKPKFFSGLLNFGNSENPPLESIGTTLENRVSSESVTSQTRVAPMEEPKPKFFSGLLNFGNSENPPLESIGTTLENRVFSESVTSQTSVTPMKGPKPKFFLGLFNFGNSENPPLEGIETTLENRVSSESVTSQKTNVAPIEERPSTEHSLSTNSTEALMEAFGVAESIFVESTVAPVPETFMDFESTSSKVGTHFVEKLEKNSASPIEITTKKTEPSFTSEQLKEFCISLLSRIHVSPKSVDNFSEEDGSGELDMMSVEDKETMTGFQSLITDIPKEVTTKSANQRFGIWASIWNRFAGRRLVQPPVVVSLPPSISPKHEITLKKIEDSTNKAFSFRSESSTVQGISDSTASDKELFSDEEGSALTVPDCESFFRQIQNDAVFSKPNLLDIINNPILLSIDPSQFNFTEMHDDKQMRSMRSDSTDSNIVSDLFFTEEMMNSLTNPLSNVKSTPKELSDEFAVNELSSKLSDKKSFVNTVSNQDFLSTPGSFDVQENFQSGVFENSHIDNFITGNGKDLRKPETSNSFLPEKFTTMQIQSFTDLLDDDGLIVHSRIDKVSEIPSSEVSADIDNRIFGLLNFGSGERNLEDSDSLATQNVSEFPENRSSHPDLKNFDSGNLELNEAFLGHEQELTSTDSVIGHNIFDAILNLHNQESLMNSTESDTFVKIEGNEPTENENTIASDQNPSLELQFISKEKPTESQNILDITNMPAIQSISDNETPIQNTLDEKQHIEFQFDPEEKFTESQIVLDLTNVPQTKSLPEDHTPLQNVFDEGNTDEESRLFPGLLNIFGSGDGRDLSEIPADPELNSKVPECLDCLENKNSTFSVNDYDDCGSDVNDTMLIGEKSLTTINPLSNKIVSDASVHDDAIYLNNKADALSESNQDPSEFTTLHFPKSFMSSPVPETISYGNYDTSENIGYEETKYENYNTSENIGYEETKYENYNTSENIGYEETKYENFNTSENIGYEETKYENYNTSENIGYEETKYENYNTSENIGYEETKYENYNTSENIGYEETKYENYNTSENIGFEETKYENYNTSENIGYEETKYENYNTSENIGYEATKYENYNTSENIGHEATKYENYNTSENIGYEATKYENYNTSENISYEGTKYETYDNSENISYNIIDYEVYDNFEKHGYELTTIQPLEHVHIEGEYDESHFDIKTEAFSESSTGTITVPKDLRFIDTLFLTGSGAGGLFGNDNGEINLVQEPDTTSFPLNPVSFRQSRRGGRMDDESYAKWPEENKDHLSTKQSDFTQQQNVADNPKLDFQDTSIDPQILEEEKEFGIDPNYPLTTFGSIQTREDGFINPQINEDMTLISRDVSSKSVTPISIPTNSFVIPKKKAKDLPPRYCNHAGECHIASNEGCITKNGRSTCDCRRSFVRHPETDICEAPFMMRTSLKLPGEVFHEDLRNKHSELYRNKTRDAIDTMWLVVYQDPTLEHNLADIAVSGFEEGSLVIHWQLIFAVKNVSISEIVQEVNKKLEEKFKNRAVIMTAPLNVENAQMLSFSDINPCEKKEQNYCSQDADCIRDDSRGFRCRCKNGFLDNSKNPMYPGEICIAACPPDYCGENGYCELRLNGEKQCLCNGWYFGENCNVSGILVISCFAGANGVLILLILATVLICKRRRQRGTRFYDNNQIMFQPNREMGPFGRVSPRLAASIALDELGPTKTSKYMAISTPIYMKPEIQITSPSIMGSSISYDYDSTFDRTPSAEINMEPPKYDAVPEVPKYNYVSDV